MFYNKNTNELTSVPPWGNSWVHDEIKEQYYAQGWQVVDEGFLLPEREKTVSEKISGLEEAYQPQFLELAQALNLATLDGNQTVIDGIKEDYASLKAEYQAKKEAINNGD